MASVVLRFVSLAASAIFETSAASGRDSFHVDRLPPGDTISIRETPDAEA